jgi:hypothetical protein
VPADDTYGPQSQRWHGISRASCQREMCRVRTFCRPSADERRTYAVRLVAARRQKPAQRAAAVYTLFTANAESVQHQRGPAGSIYRQVLFVPPLRSGASGT